jgi:hypothetical protein
MMLLVPLCKTESVEMRHNGDLVLLDRMGQLFIAPLQQQQEQQDDGSSSSSSCSRADDAGDARGTCSPSPAAASSPRWDLPAAPLAHLGPGRPLGYQEDGAGGLLVCDSLKVRY